MIHQELFEAISDSAILLDKAGRVLNWNAGAASLFGYHRKETLGRSINFIYQKNYPFPKLIQEISSEQSKWLEHTPFVRKNGIKGFCKTYLYCLPPNQHNKITALLIHQNLSEHKQLETEWEKNHANLLRKLFGVQAGFLAAANLLIKTQNLLEQTERKLRESELRFHLLAENATDVISRHTPDGYFLYVSPSSQHALGYDPNDLFNKNIFKLIYYEDLAKVKKAFARRREIPSDKPIVYRIKRKEGEYRWFESNIRMILDEQTRAINEIQLASRDITDQVLDRKAGLRGKQLAHVFRLSTMEEMASGMAHEISQPLTAVIHYTRGCERHLENKSHDLVQLKTIMGKAVEQAERAGEIIQRLKNFFCKGQLVKTPCKISNVVRETLRFIKHEITVSKTKIEVYFEKNIPLIFIDKIQIQQVLLNLIQNSIEAMEEYPTKEKHISIETKRINSETIAFVISDTGPGFSKENIYKVFMPFFTTKSYGRGMGLAICRSIIEAHGGQFTIYPNTNGASSIQFTLPISI